MKRGILLLTLAFCFSILCAFSIFGVFASESDNMDISVNLLQSYVGFSAQDSLFLGNLTTGFDSDEIGFKLNNTGTTNIRITAELQNSSDPIFSHLYLSNSTTDDKFQQVNEFISVLTMASTYGSSHSLTYYAKLKLSEYTDEITQDKIGYSNRVIFWASAV